MSECPSYVIDWSIIRHTHTHTYIYINHCKYWSVNHNFSTYETVCAKAKRQCFVISRNRGWLLLFCLVEISDFGLIHFPLPVFWCCQGDPIWPPVVISGDGNKNGRQWFVIDRCRRWQDCGSLVCRDSKLVKTVYIDNCWLDLANFWKPRWPPMFW